MTNPIHSPLIEASPSGGTAVPDIRFLADQILASNFSCIPSQMDALSTFELLQLLLQADQPEEFIRRQIWEIREFLPVGKALAHLALQQQGAHDPFFRILFSFEDDFTRQELFEEIFEQVVDQPFHKLFGLFADQLDHWSHAEQPARFLQFIRSFGNLRCGDFLEWLILEANPEQCGEIFSLTEEEKLAEDVVKIYLTKCPSSADIHIMLTKYCAILKEDKRTEGIFLRLWLRSLDENSIEYNILYGLERYNTRICGYLLSHLPENSLRKFATYYLISSNIESLLRAVEKALLHIKTLKEKIAFLHNLFLEFEKDRLGTLLDDMISYESSASPLLPAILNNESFFFFLHNDPELFSNALRMNHMLAPGDASELIDHLNRMGRIDSLKQGRIDIVRQDSYPFGLYYSFESIMQLVEDMLASENGMQKIEDYQEDLQLIPEFLLSIAVREDRYRNLLLPMMRFLGTGQIKSIAEGLQDETCEAFLDAASTQILTNQFKHLLTHLTPKQRAAYFRNKTNIVQNLRAGLSEEYQSADNQLRVLNTMEISSGLKVYRRMLNQAEEAYIRYARISHEIRSPIWGTIYHCLKITDRLSPEGQALKDELDKGVKQVGEYEEKRRAEGGPLDLLKKLQLENWEEETGISEEYWSLLNISYLRHFQLSEIQEIERRGIRSDADFALLNLLPGNRTEIDRLCQKINGLAPQTAEMQIELDNQWSRLIFRTLAEPEHASEQPLLDLYGLYPYEETIALLTEILTTIEEIAWLPNEEREKATELSVQSIKSMDLIEKRTFCLDSARLAIQTVIRHSFPLVLKRYLTQPNLAAIWEYFTLSDIRSLSQLKELHPAMKEGDFCDLFPLSMEYGFEPQKDIISVAELLEQMLIEIGGQNE